MPTAISQNTQDILLGKAVTVFDTLQHGAITIGNEVVKYTPDIINAGLTVVSVGCIQQVLNSVYNAVTVGVCIFVVKKCVKYITDNGNSDQSSKEFWCLVNVLACIAALVIGIISFVNCSMLNIWQYIGIFNPKLYLAHELMQKVLT